MRFKKMTKRQYPSRLWSLVGYPGSGKSTFATQMRAPSLVVDADHRFAEVLDLAIGDVYELGGSPADNVDTNRITALLADNMPGSEVGTIVVDSLTAIIVPLVVQAMRDNEAGLNKNKVAAFKAKALAMRQLQDAVTCWGTDVLWVYHLQDARDNKARAVTRTTISETELARLTRSVNLQLEIVRDGEKRGVKVVWARRGRSGMTLWDESGTWAGMPEKIEVAVYDGLSLADQAEIERAAPASFPNPETAIAWGVEQGAFGEGQGALPHARNAYHKLKREHNPRTAEEMAALWIADVQARLLSGDKDSKDESNGDAPLTESLWQTWMDLAKGSLQALGGDGDDDGSSEEHFICVQCGQSIVDYQANGDTYTASRLVEISDALKEKGGPGHLCGPCLKALKETLQHG